MKLKIEFGFGVQFRGNGDAILGHEQVKGLGEILRAALDLFGGYTRFDTFGAWLDPDTKEVVAEAGCTVSVLVARIENEEDQNILGGQIDMLVTCIKRSLHQKAVCVTLTDVTSSIL